MFDQLVFDRLPSTLELMNINRHKKCHFTSLLVIINSGRALDFMR